MILKLCFKCKLLYFWTTFEEQNNYLEYIFNSNYKEFHILMKILITQFSLYGFRSFQSLRNNYFWINMNNVLEKLMKTRRVYPV